MIEGIIISLILLAVSALSFMAGYRVSKKINHTTYENPPSVYKKTIKQEPITSLGSGQTTTEWNEPSGIIYRPNAEELAKMNEDKAVKEAKEAMAETIKNTPEPTT